MSELLGADKYEYHLHYWGEVENENWIERDLGIVERDFWFPNAGARDTFKKKLRAVADARNVFIAFGEHEGRDVRRKTVANMKFKLPTGEVVPFSYDFGFGYPADSAEFMFTEGNYACDCNRSLFLSHEHQHIEEMDCGDEIEMLDFAVDMVAPNA